MAIQGYVIIPLAVVVNIVMCGIAVLVSDPSSSTTRSNCPCSDQSWCQPITDTIRKEVFIFTLKKDSPVAWKRYDWSKVTTVSVFGHYSNLQLMCLAHKNGARAVTTAAFDRSILTNSSARTAWVQEQLAYVKENHLDGLNFDFEEAVLNTQSEIREGYTKLVAEAKSTFKASLPYSQVTVDVAWSPNDIDQRNYDYKGLAENSDFLFVMAYDEQSQIRGKCVAGANSHFNYTLSGMKSYLQLGIPSDKLLLALPWYGYNYSCLSVSATHECAIQPVPFRGVNCSDAAGNEIDYRTVKTLLKNSSTGRLWDSDALSPFFNYKDPISGADRQVRYDDPTSLKYKYQIADDLNLRGVGIYEADDVDDGSDADDNIRDIAEMWGALPRY